MRSENSNVIQKEEILKKIGGGILQAFNFANFYLQTTVAPLTPQQQVTNFQQQIAVQQTQIQQHQTLMDQQIKTSEQNLAAQYQSLMQQQQVLNWISGKKM